VPAILGAVIGGALAARVTPVYRSEALLRVVPQRTPESLVPSTTSTEIGNRLQMMWMVIASRTRLEHLIQEFDLYKEERRKGGDRREIVEHMLKNVEMNVAANERGDAVAFRIGFIGTEPGTVMRVAERLTAAAIQENLRVREQLAEGTHDFLTARLEDTRPRLVEKNKQLRAARDKRQPEAETLAIELEVLQTTFRDLSAKTEESRIAAERQGGQSGGELTLLEPARLPERPIAPDWRKYIGGGAGAGVAVGVLVLLLGPTRSVRKRRESLHAEAAAPDESAI
jgi:uncharacterized protein involved in exopolysaccharide biosynthesis